MRILCLGDSPFIHTGFGIVNKVATDYLISQGHELVVLGGQDTQAHEAEGMVFIPIDPGLDMMGHAKAKEIIQKIEVDAVHIIGDPTSVVLWAFIEGIRNLPIVAYMPVEGAPFNKLWTRQLAIAPDIQYITCSNYGQKVLAGVGIDARMAYHGVSPDFRPPSEGRRAQTRAMLGWSDKFVVMCVAQNVRRKQWPRLFEAIKLASRQYPDIVLYAHTLPFNNNWLGGHDLAMIAEFIGVQDRVFFSPDLADKGHNASVPLGSDADKIGLVDLYGMADVFVLPSQVEGFGLPLAEAMACNLPVVTTDYAAGAEVVGKAGLLLPPYDWEWNQAGARYANVDPRDIASAITKLRASPELRKTLIRRGSERVRDFTWDAYRTALGECFDAISSRVPSPSGEQAVQD